MKTLTLLKSLIDNKVDDHFETTGIYDYLESGKKEFEFEFIFDQGQKYRVNLHYNIETHGIWKKEDILVFDQKENMYCVQDEDLIISNKKYNPGKLSIEQRIDAIIKHEKRKADENPDVYNWSKGTIL